MSRKHGASLTDVERKYKKWRHYIEPGDIFLVRGNSFLTRTIEYADSAYYSHAGVVFGVGERLLCVQSQADGVQPCYLSKEIAANVDFCIIKPKFNRARIEAALDKYFSKAEKGIPYDFSELVRILLVKKFGFKIKNIQGNKHEAICSVSSSICYGGLLPIECYQIAYKKKGYLTPQDLIRWANKKEVDIIADSRFVI